MNGGQDKWIMGMLNKQTVTRAAGHGGGGGEGGRMYRVTDIETQPSQQRTMQEVSHE